MYSQDEMNVMAVWIFFIAMACFRLFQSKKCVNCEMTLEKQRTCEKQSIQLVSCLLALYSHAPLALSNVSLFLISAFLWIPLLSFMDYGKLAMASQRRRMIVVTLILGFLGCVGGVMLQWMVLWSRYNCVVVAPMLFLVLVLTLF
jgi:hypothetical protein